LRQQFSNIKILKLADASDNLLLYNHHFPVLELNDLLNNASELILPILEKIKPLKLFEEYLQIGYYPFFKEGEAEFQIMEHYGKPSF